MTDLSISTPAREELQFGGLRIGYDSRILRPRPWTVMQSQWAAELLPSLPAGAVLELCSGAGHIGLAAVADSQRRLVCVDRDPVAAAYTASNAAHAGLTGRVEVRLESLDEALADSERFALVIADPPWVRTEETRRWPEDPLGAIDGGPDGLAVARLCLDVSARHLARGGAVLVQLGTVGQADDLRPLAADLGLSLSEVRVGEGGVVALFGEAAADSPA